MEKEESQNKEDQNLTNENSEPSTDKQAPEETEIKEEVEQLSPEDEIANLKDKVARTFAEMENQRRRFEKEKDEAFEYGGFSFARETLNLLDNLERSKQTLESDETIKRETYKILERFKEYPGYIFNLGHGITPDISPDKIKYLTNIVREY